MILTVFAKNGLRFFLYFYIIGNMEELCVIQALAALAQETRLRIFRLLVQAGLCGMRPGRIAEALDIPAATLSFHLKEMKHAGILSCEKQGRSLIYAANFLLMNDLMAYLMENCCQRPDCGERPECAPVGQVEQTPGA